MLTINEYNTNDCPQQRHVGDSSTITEYDTTEVRLCTRRRVHGLGDCCRPRQGGGDSTASIVLVRADHVCGRIGTDSPRRLYIM
jgi:hypothetical protein